MTSGGATSASVIDGSMIEIDRARVGSKEATDAVGSAARTHSLAPVCTAVDSFYELRSWRCALLEPCPRISREGAEGYVPPRKMRLENDDACPVAFASRSGSADARHDASSTAQLTLHPVQYSDVINNVIKCQKSFINNDWQVVATANPL